VFIRLNQCKSVCFCPPVLKISPLNTEEPFFPSDMKKKRKKKKRRNRDRANAAFPNEAGKTVRYDRMLQQGREQLEDYYKQAGLVNLDNLALDLDKIMETEPTVSLNEIAKRHGVTLIDLYSGITTSKDRTIISYYSRPEIQQAIFSYAQDRKIAVVRRFQPMFERLRSPEDILPLMVSISESCTEGNQWPSMHGTIARYGPGRQMTGCDLVAEVDFKNSWARSFDIARPLVKLFRELGVFFLIKFSGHTSPHIIIPEEAIPEELHGFRAFRSFFILVKSKIRSHLDTSFTSPSHFLRLPYSIHELTGKASLPVRPEDYDSFSPKMARIGSVEVLEDWWPVPPDARERNQALVDYMTSMKKQVAVKKELKADKPRRLWEQMVEAFEKGAHLAEGRIKPVADDDSYNQMIQAGQRELEYKDSLLEDESLVAALMELMDSEHNPSVKRTAREQNVDPEKLWFLWRWSLRRKAFKHYSQPHIQQAIYSYVENRKILLAAGTELYMDLRDPSHILPLMAYAHANQGRKNWPGFQRTKGIYSSRTHDLTGADIVIDFDFRNGSCDRAVKLMKPLTDMMQDSQVTFSINFDGNSNFQLVIPSAAIPTRIAGRKIAFEHYNIAENLSIALRRIIKASTGNCSWAIVPYKHTCVPYSVNEHTGMVCVPVDMEDLESFSPESAQAPLAEVSETLPVPDDAPRMTEAFLRKIL